MAVNLRYNTALHFAYECDHGDLVKTLLLFGGEKALKMRNSIGKTPLELNQKLAKELGFY